MSQAPLMGQPTGQRLGSAIARPMQRPAQPQMQRVSPGVYRSPQGGLTAPPGGRPPLAQAIARKPNNAPPRAGVMPGSMQPLPNGISQVQGQLGLPGNNPGNWNWMGAQNQTLPQRMAAPAGSLKGALTGPMTGY